MDIKFNNFDIFADRTDPFTFKCVHCDNEKPLTESPIPLEQIPRISPDADYQSVFWDHLIQNKPFILESEATNTWESRSRFVIHDEETGVSRINFKFLKQQYGHAQGSISICTNKEDTEFKTENMEVGDFMEYWEEFIASGYPAEKQILYLKDFRLNVMKDWELNKLGPDFDSNFSAYEVSKYFKSDWLNSQQSPDNDFKFMYMGPKGSWTNIHCDVLNSFSWSTNVVGRKEWYLFPPGNEVISQGKNTFDPNEHFGVEDVHYVKCVQEVGETMFIPSGWFHKVHNVEDTISINHNFFNAANICHVWKNLQKALINVEKELEDFVDNKEFNQLCQDVLKANDRMNYSEIAIVLVKSFKSILQIRRVPNNSLSTKTDGSLNQFYYDVGAILHTCNLMFTDPKFLELVKKEIIGPAIFNVLSSIWTYDYKNDPGLFSSI